MKILFSQNKIRNSSKVQFLRDIAQADEPSIANFQQKIMRVYQKLVPRKSFVKKSVPKERYFFKKFLILLILTSILSPFVNVNAAINKQINYQGKLTTPAGVAVADGTYNMEFALYTVSSAGTAIWTETRTTTDKVQVTSGLFSVLLGEVTTLAGVNFNQTLYLGVNIGGTGTPGWDGEMTPRKKLGAVPAAVVSENAINMIGGVAGAVPYQSAARTTLFSAAGTTGQTLISGGTGSPTWFAPTAGSVLFAGTSGILQQDNANLFWDDSIDRLGIGQTVPTSKLDITTTALGVTQTTSSGLALVNTTAAAAGAQQISPALRWSGFGWKTDATAASQAVDFRSYVVPVQGAANPTGYLAFESSVNGGAYSDRMVIDSAGNVGIGTTVASSFGNSTSKQFTIFDTGTSRVGLSLVSDPANADDPIGILAFLNEDSSNTAGRGGPRILGMRGTTDNSGYLRFDVANNADAAAALTISQSGNMSMPSHVTNAFIVGAATSPSGAIHIEGPGQTRDFYSVKDTSTSYPNVVLNVLNSAGAQAGSITHTAATTVAYNTSSDRRLKENIIPTTIGLSTLIQIPVSDYNFISDPAKQVQGFIAQDLYNYYPDAVSVG